MVSEIAYESPFKNRYRHHKQRLIVKKDCPFFIHLRQQKTSLHEQKDYTFR